MNPPILSATVRFRPARVLATRKRLLLLLSMFIRLPCFAAAIACDEIALRTAVEEGGLVRFGCDGTIHLSRPLTISKNTILDGSGHQVILSGGGRFRILQVQPGITLSLTNLVLTQGYATGRTGTSDPEAGDAEGGAILSLGSSLVAVDCAFTSNRVVGALGFTAPTPDVFPRSERGGHAIGGAVSVHHGSVWLERCLFQGNSVQGGIGGFYQDGSSIRDSTSEGGNALGGGVHLTAETVALRQCRFLDNESKPGRAGHLPISSSTAALFTKATGAGLGGALYRGGSPDIGFTCLIDSCTFQSNRVVAGFNRSGGPQGGGGIYNGPHEMTLHGTTLVGNQADASTGIPCMGGGIYNEGRLALHSCQFVGNLTRGAGVDSSGGAVFNAGRCTIESSQFRQNLAQGGHWFYSARFTFVGQGKGGALYNSGGVTLLDSSFMRNQAEGGKIDVNVGEAFGGAVFNTGVFGGTNLTFFENTTQPAGTLGSSPGPSLGGYGGAFYNQGTSILAHATFAANSVLPTPTNPNNPSQGGSIFSANGPVELFNSLLMHGSSGSNCVGLVWDLGGNLSSDGSCRFASGLIGIDPLLGPLLTQGVVVPVLPLLPGSPAIDAGLASPLAFDARGATRPFGAKPDIGAFESHGEININRLWVDRLPSGQIQLYHYAPTDQARVLESSSDLQTWSVEPPETIQRDPLSRWLLPLDAAQRWFRVRWQ